jgi:hypothetical protein
MRIRIHNTAYQDPDGGQKPVLRIRIRGFFDPWIGSGIGFFPDPGSRIPTPYFLELNDKFLGKTGPNFFLQHLKN